MTTRKVLLLVTVLSSALMGYAQDTLWISKKGSLLPSKDSAVSYSVTYKDKADTQLVKILIHSSDGTIQSERNFHPYRPKPVANGFYRIYNAGKLADEKIYTNGKLNGTHKVFRENGMLKRMDTYENGTFISGKCFGADGSDTAWFEYEIPASFPGGKDSLRQYIVKHFYYPPDARDNWIQGTVQVLFTITKEGAIADIKIRTGVHPLLDKEAIRLVGNMPNWIPATQEEKPVSSSFILPVTFRLSNN